MSTNCQEGKSLIYTQFGVPGSELVFLDTFSLSPALSLFAEKSLFVGSELGTRSSSPATNSHKYLQLLFSSARIVFFKHTDREHSLSPLPSSASSFFVFSTWNGNYRSLSPSPSERHAYSVFNRHMGRTDGRAGVGQKNLLYSCFSSIHLLPLHSRQLIQQYD